MSSSDVSSVTNHFSVAAEGFITTTAGSVASAATTVPLNATTGLTNGNVFVGIIEPGTSGKEQTFTGLVDTAGSQITNVIWTRGTNTTHSAGVTVVDYVSGSSHNMTTKGILVEHSQDGTHGNITPDSVTTPTLTVSGNSTIGGTIGVTGAATLASLVLNGSLTGTGLAAQVSTQVNAGSAGGNMWWINLGGLKILWGLGATQSVGTGGGNFNFTLPSFFTTVQSYFACGTTPGTSANQYTLVNTASTSQIQVYTRSDTNGSSIFQTIFVIGT
jgi:hypothetical protein